MPLNNKLINDRCFVYMGVLIYKARKRGDGMKGLVGGSQDKCDKYYF